MRPKIYDYNLIKTLIFNNASGMRKIRETRVFQSWNEFAKDEEEEEEKNLIFVLSLD